jgi:hypothetical protein
MSLFNKSLHFLGKLSLPVGNSSYFFLSAQRNEDGEFEFKDGLDPIALNFNLLKMQPDEMSQYCLAAKFEPLTSVFKLFESDCNLDNRTVCRMWKNEMPDCSLATKFAKKVLHSFLNITKIKCLYKLLLIVNKTVTIYFRIH